MSVFDWIDPTPGEPLPANKGSLRDALLLGDEIMRAKVPTWEPIIVSPEQYADPVFMAALREEFPRGRRVWRLPPGWKSSRG
jgi:hypothetical protein